MPLQGFISLPSRLGQWCLTRGAASCLAAVALLAPLAASSAWAQDVSDKQKEKEARMQLFGVESDYNHKALTHLEKALEIFRGGDGDKALDELKKASEADKTLPPGRVLRARMLFALNAQQAVTAARSDLEQAVKDDPTSPHVYLMLGNLGLAEGRLTDAELEYRQAQSFIEKAFPSDPKNKDRRGDFERQIFAGYTAICEGRQDWKGATTAAGQWLNVSQGNDKQIAQAEQRLGRAAFMDSPSDVAATKDHLERAYKADPEIGHPQVSLALLTAQKGGDNDDAREQALADADKYMRKAVSEIQAEAGAKPVVKGAVYSAASQWMLNNNRLTEAANYAAEAVKADPKSDAFQRLTALIALYQKNWSEASRLLEGMYQKAPGDAFITNNLALALAGEAGEVTTTTEKEKLKRAVDLAEISFRAYQKSAELAATLGWIYFKAERYNEAEQLLQGAVQLNNGQLSSSTAYYLSQVLARRDNLTDAVKVLESALNAPGPFPYREDAEKMMKAWKPSWKPRKVGEAPKTDTSAAPKTDTAPKKAADTTPKKTP